MDVPGNAQASLGIHTRSAHIPDLRGPDVYSHSSRPRWNSQFPCTRNLMCMWKERTPSRGSQSRDYLQGPNRRHANLVDEISAALSRAPRRAGGVAVRSMSFRTLRRICLINGIWSVCVGLNLAPGNWRRNQIFGVMRPQPARFLVFGGLKY